MDIRHSKSIYIYSKLFQNLFLFIWLGFLFFFNSGFIYCVTAQADIDKNAGSNSKINEVESLIDSAYQKIIEVDWGQSALFSQRALEKSNQYNYQKGIAWSNFYLAQALFEGAKYKAALHHLNTTESLKFTKEDVFLRFEIFRIRTRIYGSTSHFKAAIAEQKKGLQIIDKINKSSKEKKYLVSLCYDNLANTFELIKELDSSFFYRNQNKVLLESMDESFVYPNLVNLYSGLGGYYTGQNNFTEAEKYFLKSLKLSEKYKYNYLSYNFEKWGDMEEKRNNIELAFKYYFLALENVQKTGMKHEIPGLYKKLSLIYNRKGDKKKYEEYRLKSLDTETEIQKEQLQSSELILDKIAQEIEVKNTHRTAIYFYIVGVFALLILFFTIHWYYNKKNIESLKVVNKENLEIIENHKIESVTELITLAKENSYEFWPRFQEVFPKFTSNLIKINSKITNSEQSLAAYIYLGFSSKEIAHITFRSLKTIETTRYNLRKKLNLSSKINLKSWLSNITS